MALTEASPDHATTAVVKDTSPETALSPELSAPEVVVATATDHATTAARPDTCPETAPTSRVVNPADTKLLDP